MKEKLTNKLCGKWAIFLFALIVGLLFSGNVLAFTVNVLDQNDNPVSGFKWLLEEDNTHEPMPGVHRPVDTTDVFNNTLSISIHKSHAPVVNSGEEINNSFTAITTDATGSPLANGRYFLSVLPYGNANVTYDIGGVNVTVPGPNVTVYVRTNPIETAQISVKVFHDGNGGPLNNAFEIGEPGLAGFTVTLTDQGGDILLDAFGNPLCGTGDCITDANGEILIQNLAPGKYGVEVVPPTGEGWHQLTTIEGTKTIDAWVRPNEPPFFREFGPPLWHAFFGFTKLFNNIPAGGSSTVTGTVLKGHLSRPPDIVFYDGPPPEGEAVGERCIVGLNSNVGGTTQAIWAGLCDDGTGNFTIPNVPAGTYQLVIWDVSLLQIISFATVTVDGINPMDMGNINVPMWFGTQEHYVFFDDNLDFIFNNGDTGIPEQNVNLRFRDGTIYQAFPTDTEGFVPFQSVFPFFHWLVSEVDFANYKATSLRATNDLGGPVTFDADGEGKRNPSVHEYGGTPLLQAYQLFAGQNLRFEWAKEPYSTDENGGISGVIFYATTRAEDDPRLAAGEPWEPGIPRVQVSLYKDMLCNSNGFEAVYPVCPEASPGEVGDGIPDPLDPNALGTPPWAEPYIPIYSDVDNHPLGNFPGPEDVDNGTPSVFDYGDAISVSYSDSWDDAPPTGCEPADVFPITVHGTDVPIEQCADGLRTWNQTRPGVFDGGYAFGPVIDCADINGDCNAVTSIGADGMRYLNASTYIVQAATPPGYKTLKEEDRNVDFGLTPIPAILPPKCVGLNPDGSKHLVPPYMSFATRADGSLLPWADPVDHAAPYAGQERFLCDTKKVDLGSGQNTASDFFLLTDVPKAARAVGILTGDLGNEISPGKPQFSEKFAPTWIPIAIFDYSGRMINHTYSDEFGAYNWLAPATYSIDLPTPSGVGPKMHNFCLNFPTLPDGSPDPFYESQYSTTCFTFNFENARITYLDTPVIRQAAFTGPLQTQLDCEAPANTPVIAKVTPTGNPDINGTLINGTAGEQFTIWSVGTVQVRNPAYPGGTLGNSADPPTEPQYIPRDFGFGGTAGTVNLNGIELDIFSWSDFQIVAQIPAGGLPAGTYQLMVTSPGGTTPYGVTMTVGPASIVRVGPTQANTTIQAGIDAANNNDLVLIDPGTYTELPILYKKVALQGAGAGSTTINATHFGTGTGFVNSLEVWQAKVALLTDGSPANGEIGLLPEQETVLVQSPEFFLKDGEGPGIFVSPLPGIFDGTPGGRIDGFTITLGDQGGGIWVNAYTNHLQISNNSLRSNSGNLGGGIRVGNSAEAGLFGFTTTLPYTTVQGSPNKNINIHHNQIIENGSLAMGGGISILKGSGRYRITDNNICGNFARSGGGGVAHRGYSNLGLIRDNNIVFNEVFQGNQPGVGLGIGGGGGGIEIAGDPDADGNGLTQGTGEVTISDNHLQGNLGGAADGGAIALRNINGDDVVASANPADWNIIRVARNVIVNNVSGNGGGGIGLQDAARVVINRNTIAHNDSTAVSVFAGVGTPPTIPQPAGLVSRAHSDALAAVTGQSFSDPVAFNRNIFYKNRSFYWDDTAATNEQGGLLPNVAAGAKENWWDFGITGTAVPECLTPTNSILTRVFNPNDSACTYPSDDGLGNRTRDPGFTAPYFNSLLAAAAADEGGNFVQVYYTPLSVQGDYSDIFGRIGP